MVQSVSRRNTNLKVCGFTSENIVSCSVCGGVVKLLVLKSPCFQSTCEVSHYAHRDTASLSYFFDKSS